MDHPVQWYYEYMLCGMEEKGKRVEKAIFKPQGKKTRERQRSREENALLRAKTRSRLNHSVSPFPRIIEPPME